MATVIARLPVDDVDAWAEEFERMHEVRERHGEQGRTLYLDADDPQAVVVVFRWDSVQRAKAYFGSTALRDSVQRAGGRSAPTLLYLENPPSTDPAPAGM